MKYRYYLPIRTLISNETDGDGRQIGYRKNGKGRKTKWIKFRLSGTLEKQDGSLSGIGGRREAA